MNLIMVDHPDYQVEPRYLTAEQCAVRFAISLRHFKYLVAAGEMPQPVRFGKSIRWPIESLEEFETEKMMNSTKTKSRRSNSRFMRKK